LINYGQQLFKSFHRVKRSSMNRLNHKRFNGLKPHEFFMLITILNRYSALKTEHEANGLPIPPGLKISELSRCSEISMPGVSQIITNLVKQGYVKRITTDMDRRLVYVNLTEKGAALEKEYSQSCFQIYDDAAAILGTKDTTSLISLLDKLSTALDTLDGKRNDEKQNENTERKTP